MFIRKIALSIFLIMFLFNVSVSPLLAAEPQIEGRAAAVIDSKSGQIIYGFQENVPLPPASITKILTAILAIEKTKPTDMVKIGKNPPLCEPSSIGLKEGETISMENLLYALMIKSANDSAVAIAEKISGSVPDFAKLMNKRAMELGATNTNFVNPNGLPDPNHHSTAHDLAIMAKYLMTDPLIRKIVSTKQKTIPRADDTAVKWLPNHNKMLWQYEGANGVKTGYTSEAKQCLVASAVRGNQEFIAVVLGSQGSNVWTDATSLLDYGFNNFATIKQKDSNILLKTVGVKKGSDDVGLITEKDFYYTLPKGQAGSVTEKVEVNSNITAPVKKGQVLGHIKFFLSSKELGSVNLVAQNNVARTTFGAKYKGSSELPMIVGVVLLILFVGWNIVKRKNKYSRKTKWWHNRNGIR